MNLESFNFQFKNKLKVIPPVCLLGIRGYNYESGKYNQMFIYDDAIVRCIDGVIKIFTASVDPGKYYVDNPLNPNGCARLQSGLWTYRLGEHNHRPALIQGYDVIVDRLDKNGTKKSEENGFFGINIHSGGPEYQVGRYSAGCQIIKCGEAWKFEWLDFFLPIRDAMTKTKQQTVPYLLVDRLKAIPQVL